MSTPDASYDLKRLLAQAGWIRRLAANLIHDPGTADDVAQETLLAAMKESPEPKATRRGWLAGTVRNRAKARWRSEQRRAKRELAVGRKRGHAPSTADVAERVEAQRHLAQAILVLDDPIRSTIVRHYLDGISMAEIARQEGVASATVRSRHARGLVLLRRELDGRYDSDRNAWQKALSPFAATGGGAAVETVTVAALSVMEKVLIGGIVASLVACAFLLSHILRQPDASDTVVKRASEGLMDPTGQPVGLRGRGTKRGPFTVPDANMRRWQDMEKGSEDWWQSDVHGICVSGRVVDAEGQPIERAVVYRIPRWTRSSGDTNEDDGSDAGTISAPFTATDANGKFSFRSHELHGDLRLRFFASNYAVNEAKIEVEPGQDQDVGTIVLSPGGEVRGRVVDERGVPVEGADVTLELAIAATNALSPNWRRRHLLLDRFACFPSTAKTSGDGTFLLRGVGEDVVCVLAHARGRHSAFSELLEVVSGRTIDDVEVVLRPLGPKDAVRGIVRFEDGRAVRSVDVHAKVNYEYGRWNTTIYPDSSGAFELYLPKDAKATIQAKSNFRGFTSSTFVNLIGSPTVHDFVLRKVDTVRVNIDTTDGVQPNHVTVRCKSTEGSSNSYPRDGLDYVDAEIPDGVPFELIVDARGYQKVALGPYTRADVPDPLNVTLQGMGGVTGIVMANGKPFEGATVRLFRVFDDTEGATRLGFPLWANPMSSTHSTSTTMDGRFALSAEDQGAHIVRAEAEGFAPAESQRIEFTNETRVTDLKLSLDEGGSLRGHVRGNHGHGVRNVIVGISRGDGHPRTTRTDEHGAYTFSLLMPGRYEVRLVRRDIRSDEASMSMTSGPSPGERVIPWNVEVQHAKTAIHEITSTLPAAGHVHVRGRISMNGSPAVGCRLAVSRSVPIAFLFSMTLGDGPLAAGKADQKGMYDFELSHEGACFVYFLPVDLAHGVHRTFIAAEASSEDIEHDVSLSTGSLRVSIGKRYDRSNAILIVVAELGGGLRTVSGIGPIREGKAFMKSMIAGRYELLAVTKDSIEVMRMDQSRLFSQDVKNRIGIGSFEIVAGETTEIQIPAEK